MLEMECGMKYRKWRVLIVLQALVVGLCAYNGNWVAVCGFVAAIIMSWNYASKSNA